MIIHLIKQVNQEFIRGVDSTISPPLTTCIPLAGGAAASIGSSGNSKSPNSMVGGRDVSSGGSDPALVSLEQASVHAYKHAMYLTFGIGGMLLAVSFCSIK